MRDEFKLKFYKAFIKLMVEQCFPAEYIGQELALLDKALFEQGYDQNKDDE